MRNVFLGGVLFGSIIAAIVACSLSGGGGGGGAGSVSSVDSSKTLGSLSDTEAKQYCEDAERYQKSSLTPETQKKIDCGLTARIFSSFGSQTDTEAQSKCRKQFDECMAKPDATPDGGAASNGCDDFKARVSGCNATVAETNECIADVSTLYQQIATQDQCASAKADAGTSDSFFEQPTSCKKLNDKCPQLSSVSTGG